MKIGVTYFLIALAIILQSNTLHEYYVAVYEAGLSRNGQSIQISAKFIAHDIEEAVVRASHPFLNFGSQNEHPKKDSILNEYLKAKLDFNINGEITPFQIIGSEVELDEDLWIYIEVPLKGKINELTIYNAILTETFEAQKNIMHWDINGFKKSLIFTHLNNEQELKL